MKIYLGRHVFGLAAILFGVVTFVWRDFNTWQQIQVLGNVPHRELLAAITATIEILGGIAIQWSKTARMGGLMLGAIYLFFALLWVPRIAAEPLVYDRWGNLFEQLSQVAGALIVYATFSRSDSEPAHRAGRIGYMLFAICVVSFMLEQLFYLSGTAQFVPKWIPPGQMFWAVTTTIAFALAAVALFSGRSAPLASQLLAAMVVGFGLLVWLPILFADPHKLFNWAGNVENLSILGAAWIVTDYLSQKRSARATT